jgi:A/G-specific adenine glycosylase
MTSERRKPPPREIPADRFRQALLHWFDHHKRDLPWRRDSDPYHVWISEIMLQQTRVTAVLEHYRRFVRRFPTVERLAAARESSILAAWSGLGYYRRARMLHAAAKKIVRECSGKFPPTAIDLRGLPGIGRYTAAAIASIAFNQPVAVVDGNVERVLQRLMGKPIRGEDLWLAAQELLNRNRPGDFNQALMELGATLCLPRQPKCLLCPISEMCATRGELKDTRAAVPQKKKEIHYALACRDGSVFLTQRDKTASLMPGMWELPEILAPNGSSKRLFTLRHSITVTDYTVRVVQCELPQSLDGLWIERSRLERLPLTGLARKILRAAKVI